MRLDREQTKIIKELMKKYELTQEEVFEIIKAPTRFIRDKLRTVDVPKGLDKKNFEKATPNFNIPSIGKLYGNYYNYKRFINDTSKKSKAGSSETQDGEGDRGDSLPGGKESDG